MFRSLLTAFAVAAAVAAAPSHSDAQDCSPQTFAGAWKGEVTLCQNWDADEQQRFWFTSQGSLIIPYDWFLVLEQPDNTTPFRDGAHMDDLRYLPQTPTDLNPDGLPIGFTKDFTRRRKPFSSISKTWLGITCAACHTNQIEVTSGGETQRILIDGGPTMGDFEGFTGSLVEALAATASDDAKFERFAAAVLAKQGVSANSFRKRSLKRKLRQVTEIRRSWNARNKGQHPYGFGRLDAIGAIFNEVAAVPLDLPGNHNPADAPVSYPFLWDTPHYDRVQWNGSVENEGTGALARNIGEVLGVFGALDYARPFGNRTSVDIKKLGELEELIATLTAPQWPEAILGEIDRSPAVQDKGRMAFERYCRDCHKPTNSGGARPPFKAKMMTVAETGTDPRMAVNFATRQYETGKLEGKPTEYFRLLSDGKKIKGPKDGGVALLKYAVGGTIIHELIFDLPETLKAIKAGRVDERLASDNRKEAQIKKRTIGGAPTREAIEQYLAKPESGPGCDPTKQACYKGRSLNGIWATGPYLHNGSVRTMRELLLPARMRAERFLVGSREYDSKDMGFKNEGGFELDTSLPGNSKEGHEGPDYGNEDLLNDPELLEALLEYLKTL